MQSKTYSIDKLVLENFGPFQSAILELEKKAYVVSGVNLKDIGQKGNGAGKSFILDAIYFALTGETLSECKLEDLINEDAKSAVVELYLSGPKNIRVWRRLSSKTEGKLFVDDQEITGLVSIKDISKEVLKELGITKFDLQNYFIISKFAYKSFFNMTDTERINFFSRVINLDKIEATKKILGDEIKELRRSQTKAEGALESSEASVAAIKKQIQELSESDTDNVLDELEQVISELGVIESTLSALASEHELVLKELEDDYALINAADRADRKKLNQLRPEKEGILHTLRNIRVIKCPECGKDISQNLEGKTVSEADVEAMESRVSEIESEYGPLNDKITETATVLIETLNEIEAIKKTYHQKVEQQQKQKSLRQVRKSELQAIFRQVDSYSSSILTERESELVNNRAALDSLSSELNIVEGNLANLSRFQRVSIENILSILSAEVNKNLQRIGSEFLVNIYFDKEIKVDVERNFLKKKRLSGGERARIEVAIIFALHDLVNSASKTGLSFCAVDEILESLEPEGLYAVAKNIADSRKTFVLISQGILASNIPNRITVTKNTNNFSVVTQNG